MYFMCQKVNWRAFGLRRILLNFFLTFVRGKFAKKRINIVSITNIKVVKKMPGPHVSRLERDIIIFRIIFKKKLTIVHSLAFAYIYKITGRPMHKSCQNTPPDLYFSQTFTLIDLL